MPQQNMFQQHFQWENNHCFLTLSVSLPLLQWQLLWPCHLCRAFVSAHIQSGWSNRMLKNRKKNPKNQNAFLVTTKIK